MASPLAAGYEYSNIPRRITLVVDSDFDTDTELASLWTFSNDRW
ncbi:MAG: hypothetical protein PHF14_13775 [Verrucomicrobiota bacterium]|nr:hypothetical protein [Verrucomicrobiota bacterium]